MPIQQRKRKKQDKSDKKKGLEQQIKDATATLTKWDKLVHKQQQTVVKKGLLCSNPELWQITVVENFMAAERKCILRLCVPNSNVLSKGEEEHIKMFTLKGVIFLNIMTSVDVMRKKLTSSQKELDEINCSLDAEASKSKNFGDNKTDNECHFSEEDLVMIVMK